MAFLQACKNVDISDYKATSYPKPKNSEIVFVDFEGDNSKWKHSYNSMIVSGQGRNGTKAMLVECNDPLKYAFPSMQIALVPGQRYRFSSWIRSEGIKNSGAKMGIETRSGKNYLGGIHPSSSERDGSWNFVEVPFQVPKEAKECRLVLFIPKGKKGRAWFDDIKIEPDNPKWTIYMAYPRYNLFNKENKNRFEMIVNVAGLLPDKFMKMDLACKVEAEKEGFHFERLITVNKACLERKGRGSINILEGKFECGINNLPDGKTNFKFTLVDKSQKEIILKKTIPVNAIESQKKLPENSCILDEKGRVVVNGKPYLPIGIYMGTIKRDSLNRISESPFNCIIPYASMNMSFEKGAKSPQDAIAEVLDECARENVKVLFSVKNFYPALMRGKKCSYFGVEGADAVIKKTVELFRGHPALLAWYINDEAPLTMIPELVQRRRQINELDPYHPSLGVLMQFQEILEYGGSSDILGFDPYPVRNNQTQSMKQIDEVISLANYGSFPYWGVIQNFNWGRYKTEDYEAYMKNFRYPTEEKMRSMALLFAQGGAKGFIFYCYEAVCNEKLDKEPDKVFKKRWREICNVAGCLRKLGPFILSGNKAPRIKIKTLEGAVRANAFIDDKENISVIITGLGPDKCAAEIEVVGEGGLSSVYGGTENLSGGKYLFKGNNICSDILVKNLAKWKANK